MKKISLLFTISITAILLNSCATIFLGSTQKINIRSTPSNAAVYVNGKNTGKTTPCTIEVKRRVPAGAENSKNQQVYVLKKAGYEDAIHSDYSSIHWLFIADIPLFGVFSLIDVGTGATRSYKGNIHVPMKAVESPIIPRPEEDLIVRENTTPTAENRERSFINDSYQFQRLSAVDNNIPLSNKQYPYRFALIIGNEDYTSQQLELNSQVNVDFARNDASAFKAYAMRILGIPERNIVFILDATLGKMNQAISKMNLIAKNTKGQADIFIYYAGHGLPDETSKEPYLIPVDVSGKYAKEGIKLQDLYEKLTTHSTKRVTVFLDACFSGGARNQGLIASRGIRIRPKENLLAGNLVVFSSSSGSESSFPLQEEAHGLFTYYLLKKLQETKGKLSYKALADYLSDNITLQSVLLNDREQTPQTNVSPAVSDTWESWKINE
ncbi:MAG: caspase family protein [Bacteroidota bacterium]